MMLRRLENMNPIEHGDVYAVNGNMVKLEDIGIFAKGEMPMHRFWNFKDTDTGRTLYLDGYIAPESWFEDEVSPKEFKTELEAGTGDITVWINSPGGDFFAASQFYTMLKDYKGKVTVKIDGIAASAAAVIAMAGDEVLMSPTAMLMIHNPATFVWGEEADMQKGIEMLVEVKEAIIIDLPPI